MDENPDRCIGSNVKCEGWGAEEEEGEEEVEDLGGYY